MFMLGYVTNKHKIDTNIAFFPKKQHVLALLSPIFYGK